jgi:hypothetical protein
VRTAIRLVLSAAVAGLLLVPSSASAAKRFSACVAESSGCHHTFFGGDAPRMLFKDRQAAGTVYKVCVKDSRGRRCWHRHTGAAGQWHSATPYLNIRVAGRHMVRWYVNGTQVARWKFRLLPEGD